MSTATSNGGCFSAIGNCMARSKSRARSASVSVLHRARVCSAQTGRDFSSSGLAGRSVLRVCRSSCPCIPRALPEVNLLIGVLADRKRHATSPVLRAPITVEKIRVMNILLTAICLTLSAFRPPPSAGCELATANRQLKTDPRPRFNDLTIQPI